ncbi:hypothetical protein FGIG_01507 [Fasciola gigantica]|uniref:Transmembrane protein 151B n=1 Tax=Fasciola gigantica TaxID=46835 RepID=A0A504YUZ8_FASGI|nr:hypothetical protein FGIG_01507 [Fasciola gigantica]
MPCQHRPLPRTSKDCLIYGIQEWRCICLTVIVLTCVLGTCLCDLLHRMIRNQAYADNQQLVQQHTEDFIVESSLTTTISQYENVLKKAFCCQTTYFVICGALVFLFYLVYLIECWNSAIWLRSVYCVDTPSAYRFVDVLRHTIPIVYWHVSCYHYVTTHSPRTVTNRHAEVEQNQSAEVVSIHNPTVQPSSPAQHTPSAVPSTDWAADRRRISRREHKVITASGTRTFDLGQLDGMWDVSGEVTELDRYPLVEINILTEFLFANENIKSEFERERSAFYTSFEKYDKYMETDQTIQLSPHGSVPSQLYVSRSAPQVPLYLRQSAFFLAALFLLSYPLRIFIHSRTARLDFTVRKIFGPLSQANGSLEVAGLRFPIAIPCDLAQPTTATAPIQNKLTGHTKPEKAPHSQNNNEAVILCNRNISAESSNTPSDKFTKRWQRMRRGVSNDAHGDGDEEKADDGNEERDEEEDDELLSLDVRFDELEQGDGQCGNILLNRYVTQDTDANFAYNVQ